LPAISPTRAKKIKPALALPLPSHLATAMDNEKKGSEEKKGEETLVIVENEGGSVELDGKKEKARSEKPSAKLASLKLDFSKKEGYVPALCDGASGICFIFWLYCLLSCLIPAALLPLVLITDFDETEDWIIWAFFTALLTGVLSSSFSLPFFFFNYFFFSSRHFLFFLFNLISFPFFFFFSPRPGGIIACCYGLCCAAYGSVIKPKPAPEVLPQFVNLDSDEKKHRKIQVKKLCVIVNPFGGGGKALGLLQDVVLPIWKERGIEVEVIKTEYAGHPIDIGYELNLDNYDGICVVGGDGTLHELVNGVLMRPDKKVIPIGVIPGGTGNSFCEGIGFLSAEIAANKIADGDVCWMDSNKVILGEGKVIYSINTIGVGVVGDVGSVAEVRQRICSYFFFFLVSFLIDERNTDGSKNKDTVFVVCGLECE
jgi:hypothetical protein